MLPPSFRRLKSHFYSVYVYFIFPTSSAEMKGEPPPRARGTSKQKHWNPRPVIDLALALRDVTDKSSPPPPFFRFYRYGPGAKEFASICLCFFVLNLHKKCQGIVESAAGRYRQIQPPPHLFLGFTGWACFSMKVPSPWCQGVCFDLPMFFCACLIYTKSARESWKVPGRF
jgi:hypothetical protein